MFARILILAAVQFTLFTENAALTEQKAGEPAARSGRGLVGREAPPPAADDGSESIRSFHLKQADPYEIVRIVSELYGGVQMVAVDYANMVLCWCSNEEAQTLTRLIAELDERSMPPSEPTLRVFPIHHRSVKDILNQLGPILDTGTVQVSADEARSSLVVMSHSEESTRAIESLLKSLDTPAGSVKLEFAVFLADPSASGEKGIIPKDLEEVAIELTRFGHLKLMGRYQTTAVEGSRYRVTGDAHEGLESKIQGQVERIDGEKVSRVSITAQVGMKDIVQTDTGKIQRRGSIDIETTLTLPPNEFVALGASAAGLTPGQSLIIVTRAQP